MWCLFPAMREACNLDAGDGLNRRQSMATWGILGLAVFVPVGMAEWSKRSAMGEKVVSPQVLERALTIAAKMEDRAGVKVNANGNESGMRKAEMGLGIEDWGLRGEENFNGKAQTKAFVEPIRGPQGILPHGVLNVTAQQAEISRYSNQNKNSINQR